MSDKLPIIIIDDDNDDQELLGELARELRPNHEVKFFGNGAEALEYLENSDDQPFVILCDVNMPLMTGLELLQQIQQKPLLKRKGIPFIFMSTSGDKRYVEQAYDLNAQGFFQKPSEINELRYILKLTFDFWAKCLHPRHNQIDIS